MKITNGTIRFYLQPDGSFRAYIDVDQGDKHLKGHRTRPTWLEAILAALDDIKAAEIRSGEAEGAVPHE